MPNLYIISGCNGAGKTTASFTVLPEMLHCDEFINADEIARGLSPFNPDRAAIDAGRLMLTKIDDLLLKQKDFAFETTLATKSYVTTITRAQKKGYLITLVFSGLILLTLQLKGLEHEFLRGAQYSEFCYNQTIFLWIK